MAQVRILEGYCKGCGLCVWVCQNESLEIAHELNAAGVFVAKVKPGSECTGCTRCALMCPEGAIEIFAEDPDASGTRQDAAEQPDTKATSDT